MKKEVVIVEDCFLRAMAFVRYKPNACKKLIPMFEEFIRDKEREPIAERRLYKSIVKFIKEVAKRREP
jgi:hypothetical protein